MADIAQFARSSNLVAAVVVTLVFSGLARLTRGVTTSGAIAGAVVCFLMFAGVGPAAVLVLLSVFCLTWLATRFGYQRKQTLGTAEPGEGRKASQVLANLGVAAICAGWFRLSQGNEAWLLAMSAALAEAAADTVSSELGQTSRREPRLITTWDHVPAGTDGGISRRGTAGGLMAAAVVCVVCVLAGIVSPKRSYVALGAAMLGMLADSFLGASLERRKLLNNDAVNFASTAVAASIAAWFSHLIA
ncbi:MAG: DUF92 domain-containing protein [Terriglobales bacterium]